MSKIDDEVEDPEAKGLAEIKWPEPEFELVLRKPIKVADETVSTILLREPTTGEWEQMMAHPVPTRRRYCVSLIGAVPFKALAAAPIGDLVRGEEYINSFFEVGVAIGAK